MKQSLFVIPIFLSVLLYACTPPPENINPTPTSVPNPTADAVQPVIFSELNMAIENMEILTPIVQLEHPNGPSFQVTGVEFPQENNVPTRFLVKTRCECAENGSCCDSMRTFIVTIEAIKYDTDIIQRVNSIGTVNTMDVWCYDHATLTYKMSVPWVDAVNFMQGYINGYQLRAQVTFQPQ